MAAKRHSPIWYYLYGLVRGIAAHEDDIELIEIHGQAPNRATVLELRVHDDDAGQVVGRGGDTAASIRKLLLAFASKAKMGPVVFTVLNRKEDRW